VTITDVDNTPNNRHDLEYRDGRGCGADRRRRDCQPCRGRVEAQTVATFTTPTRGELSPTSRQRSTGAMVTTSAGTVAKSGSGFVVTGSHAYAEEGSDHDHGRDQGRRRLDRERDQQRKGR